MVVVEHSDTTDIIVTCTSCLSLVVVSFIGVVGIRRMRASEKMMRSLIILFSLYVCSASCYLIGVIIRFNVDASNASMFAQLSMTALNDCSAIVYICLLVTLVVRYFASFTWSDYGSPSKSQCGRCPIVFGTCLSWCCPRWWYC